MHPQTVLADFRTLAIDQLRESPTNPRRSFDPEKLQELAQSIRAQGVLVPLIVRNVRRVSTSLRHSEVEFSEYSRLSFVVC
jgi:ParB/RepB/Spo0J family partition protein